MNSKAHNEQVLSMSNWFRQLSIVLIGGGMIYSVTNNLVVNGTVMSTFLFGIILQITSVYICKFVRSN